MTKISNNQIVVVKLIRNKNNNKKELFENNFNSSKINYCLIRDPEPYINKDGNYKYSKAFARFI